MPKYYIQSGDLNKIVDADDYKQAIKKVFLQNGSQEAIMLAPSVLISEKGFYDPEASKEDIDRHKLDAHKMTEFSNDFVLPKDCDLFVNVELIFEIIEKGK